MRIISSSFRSITVSRSIAMIIATALSERIPLIGGDLQLKKYTGLKLIWK